MSVTLKNISKSFGRQAVLNNLFLQVEAGEFHVILGPSGEGKSTLLAMIAGLLQPDQGEVWIDDRMVNGLPPQKRPVGLVFQDYALFPHLTVSDNVAYGLRAVGLGKKAIKDRVSHYLQLVDMADCRDKHPGMLSGGQKQRVALARALATEPQILLLDEPLSHLDVSLKEQLRTELKTIQRKTGVTMLYVTHNRTEAMTLASRVSVLHQGHVEQVDTPEGLFYRPRTTFVATFVGAKNVLNARLVKLQRESAEFEIAASDLRKNLCLTTKRYPLIDREIMLRLCIHPEQIQLLSQPKQVNTFPGQIVQIDSRGTSSEVTVDVWGLILKASIPKSTPVNLHNDVWVHCPPEAIHPLCGRCQPLPEHLRHSDCRRCSNDH